MERINRDLSILYRYGQRFFTGRLGELDLEVGLLPVLMQAYQFPGVTQDQIAANRGLDKGAVARGVKKLEGKGLVRREVDPADRRINHIYTTETALRLRPRVESVIDELHEILYCGMSQEGIVQAASFARRMKENLSAHFQKAGEEALK